MVAAPIDAAGLVPDPDAVALVPATLAACCYVVPLRLDGDALEVAGLWANPEMTARLEFILNRDIRYVEVEPVGFAALFARVYGADLHPDRAERLYDLGCRLLAAADRQARSVRRQQRLLWALTAVVAGLLVVVVWRL